MKSPFGLSLSKPVAPQAMPFDKLRANGISGFAAKRTILLFLQQHAC
jgi:hypothetical protein